jgi:hypothetical protein
LTKLHRDRRGWWLFKDEDLSKIQAEAKRVEVDYASSGRSGV